MIGDVIDGLGSDGRPRSTLLCMEKLSSGTRLLPETLSAIIAGLLFRAVSSMVEQ